MAGWDFKTQQKENQLIVFGTETKRKNLIISRNQGDNEI